MKRAIALTLATALTLPIALHSAPSIAKNDRDWIESISVKMDGIDTASVKVPVTDGSYDDKLEGSYSFKLLGHVKAKKSRRVARVVWQSKQNPFFASGANKPTWEKIGLIRLGKRSTVLDTDLAIPLSRLTWVRSPAQACAALKVDKLDAGMSEDAVLEREWSTMAKASIHMKAYVTRKAAKKLTDTNHDTETARLAYPVKVACLAAAKTPKPRGSVATKGVKRQPPARAPRVPIE